MNKDKSEKIGKIDTISWYGKKKYRYQVKRGSDVLYNCISTAKYQDDVLEVLVERYRGDKSTIRIICNGDTVALLNRQKKPDIIYSINP